METPEGDPVARWPSLGRLVIDLLKLAFESVIDIFLHFVPQSLRSKKSNKGLTPIKDTLLMHEDKPEPPFVQRHRDPSPLAETLIAPNTSNSYTRKLQKSKPATIKDPSVSGKHGSSKQQEPEDFPGPDNAARYSMLGSKLQKDGSGRRHQDKSGEVVFGTTGPKPKPVEIKAVNYDDPEFDRYNSSSNFGMDDLFRF